MKKLIFIPALVVSVIAQAQLYTPNSGTFVSSNGNVGINNASPSYNLDIRGGSLRLESSLNPGRQLTFNATGSQSISATNDLSVGSARNITLNVSSSSWGQNNGALFVNNGLNGTSLLKVTDQGKVGINNGSPAYELDVKGEGYFSDYLTVNGWGFNHARINTFDNSAGSFGVSSMTGYVAGWFHGAVTGIVGIANAYIIGGSQSPEKIGVWGAAYRGERVVGVHGDGHGNADAGAQSFGVWGHAYNSPTAYGIYGDYNSGSSNGWAGYFDGSVYTTGTYQSSDRKLKDNIADLDNAMDIIESLKPRTYTFRVGEFTGMNLNEGQCMGFIADEIKEVLPNLVRETKLPEAHDEDGNLIQQEVDFESVDYVSLIPVLVKAIQEQNEMIAQLQEAVLDASDVDTPSLNKSTDEEQTDATMNKGLSVYPNPVSDELRIDLPNTTTANFMYRVFDLNGRSVMNGVLPSGGEAINVRSLVNGNYILHVSDGAAVAYSQQFTVAK